MASSSSPAAADIPSRSPSPTIPLTMTASLTLAQLPKSATDALAEANITLAATDHQKIVVRFKPVGGSAPSMPPKRELSRISAGQKFESVVAYLRRVLKVGNGDALFLYVNATFAPALDEVVGNLWRVSNGCSSSHVCAGTAPLGRMVTRIRTDVGIQCFKDSNDQLNVGYSLTPAFG